MCRKGKVHLSSEGSREVISVCTVSQCVDLNSTMDVGKSDGKLSTAPRAGKYFQNNYPPHLQQLQVTKNGLILRNHRLRVLQVKVQGAIQQS